jgi:hypothetical protein
MMKRRQWGRWAGAPALAVLLLAGTAEASRAWQASSPPGAAPATVPFGAGERAEYQVKLGRVSVGSGAMEILGTEMVRGHQTYHARLRVSGGLPLMRVDDRFESWIDVEGLFSRRFKQNQRELSFRRNRTYEFYPEQGTYHRLNTEDRGQLPTNEPLDDVSFLYFARTLPLEVGDRYVLERYFKADGNPVVLEVLRKETIKVPAGTFNTVVVRPIIKTDGLCGEGGAAEVYFTDDSRRLMVQMRSNVPLVGSLSLHMTSYRPGETLSSGSY